MGGRLTLCSGEAIKIFSKTWTWHKLIILVTKLVTICHVHLNSPSLASEYIQSVVGSQNIISTASPRESSQRIFRQKSSVQREINFEGEKWFVIISGASCPGPGQEIYQGFLLIITRLLFTDFSHKQLQSNLYRPVYVCQLVQGDLYLFMTLTPASPWPGTNFSRVPWEHGTSLE